MFSISIYAQTSYIKIEKSSNTTQLALKLKRTFFIERNPQYIMHVHLKIGKNITKALTDDLFNIPYLIRFQIRYYF